MIIGIDGTALYGRFGGVEYAVWNLLLALREVDRVNEYVVYIPVDGPSDDKLLAFSGNWRWRRLSFSGQQKLRRIVWQQIQLPHQLQHDNCDILHSPTYVAPLRSQIPILLTVYDLIAILQPQFATCQNRLHYSWALPRSITRANRIIVNADEIKAQIAQHFPGKERATVVIPLGVEPIFKPSTSSDKEKVKRKYNLPDQFMLFVGNFEPKKNLETLIKAVQLESRLPPLIIVGGVKAWRNHILSPRHQYSRKTPNLPATVVGYVPREDLPALYSMCEVFVFPTLCEGFGLPVLEAMCCGAPVVTSRAAMLPNIPALAQLCNPRDPESIATAILEVSTNAELRKRLTRWARYEAQPYSWNRAAKATLKVYQEIYETERKRG